ncbi:hypothetical protein NKJ64_21610 [Mesorhizobium sp. M0062]|uniref:hypothetical protein n=1 Tax=Mesorhizobium sp. M0062 TaxID=2956867 RepID=UPI003337BF79
MAIKSTPCYCIDAQKTEMKAKSNDSDRLDPDCNSASGVCLRGRFCTSALFLPASRDGAHVTGGNGSYVGGHSSHSHDGGNGDGGNGGGGNGGGD